MYTSLPKCEYYFEIRTLAVKLALEILNRLFCCILSNQSTGSIHRFDRTIDRIAVFRITYVSEPLRR